MKLASTVVRKLEAQELVHLRTLIADQQCRIEQLEAQLDRAEQNADFWRDQATLTDDDVSPPLVGITKEGQLVRVPV